MVAPEAKARWICSRVGFRSYRCSAAICTGSPEQARTYAWANAGVSGESLLPRRVALLDVVVENLQELGDDGVALERELEGAVHEDRRLGLLEGAGKRDADVGMLALAGAVDHAAHHRHLELFHACVLPLPHRHLVAEVGLDLLGHLLEEGRGRASAAGTRRHLREEAPQSHGLEDLLGDQHFLRAIAARLGREGDADGVADAFLEKNGETRRARHHALGAHARLAQAEVEWIVRARGELAIDVDEVLDARDLG